MRDLLFAAIVLVSCVYVNYLFHSFWLYKHERQITKLRQAVDKLEGKNDVHL